MKALAGLALVPAVAGAAVVYAPFAGTTKGEFLDNDEKLGTVG